MASVIADHVEGSIALAFGPATSNISSGVVAGATSVPVANGAVFTAGGLVLILDGGNSEVAAVRSVVVNTLTTTPLASAHGTVNVVPGTLSKGGFGPRSPYLSGG
jgi:hypothetical protein